MFETCVQFHGHVCPGLALGYNATKIALAELGVERAEDEELVAIVENDACGVDAVQVLTGCTMGKGNLIYRDYGKQVLILGNRRTGDAVRVAVKLGVMSVSEDAKALRKKVMSGQATPEEEEQFNKAHWDRAYNIVKMPKAEFAKVEKIDLEFPHKAKIFNTVTCAQCREGAMESKIRVVGGELVCLQCAGAEYNRGW
ncbi:formylmethanofuran dehydrogenase subunit E [Desulfitispora alkaliphila]|uniref:FmdE family protein n=1 Tax=Desulfitispora alkaliphila TaxID=622674 RepID=UPI003D1CA5EC